MANDEPGLALELQEIRRSLDRAEKAVRAETEERKRENEKRDKRIRWSRRAIAAVCVLAVLSLGVGIVGIVAGVRGTNAADRAQAQLNENASNTATRRIADCHSLDDVGAAAKEAVRGGLTTLLDPQFTGGAANPDLLQRFIDAFNANGASAVDAAIVQAKARKGYSADCTQIGPPPTQPGG